MQNKISDIMQSKVIVANVDDSILAVEALISENALSFVPIVDNEDNCFGVVSNLDILKFHKVNGNSKLEHIWEICSVSIVSVNASLSIEQAASLLIEKNIHHLIICQQEKIIGVVSAVDLLKYFVNKVS